MSDSVVLLLVAAILCNVFLSLSVLRGIDGLRSELVLLIRQSPYPKSNEATFHVEGANNTLGRRIKYRAEAELEGKLQVGDKSLPIRIQDLSETGAQVYCKEVTLFVGKSYPLSIMNLPNQKTVEVEVRIIRCIEQDLYGVCFEKLSLEDKSKIREFISKQFGSSMSSEIRDTST